MKQLKVSDLERKQLAEWAARARDWVIGYPLHNDGFHTWVAHWLDESGKEIIPVSKYRPDINSAQAMELQKKFNVDVLHNEDCVQAWACTDSKGIIIKNPIDCFAEIGRDEIAITRAAIASVYGETVTVEDE